MGSAANFLARFPTDETPQNTPPKRGNFTPLGIEFLVRHIHLRRETEAIQNKI